MNFFTVTAGLIIGLASLSFTTAWVMRAIHLYQTDRTALLVRASGLLLAGMTVGLIGVAFLQPVPR